MLSSKDKPEDKPQMGTYRQRVIDRGDIARMKREEHAHAPDDFSKSK